MTVSETMRRKMMDWEGCRLKAYRCPAGVLTIGYGHTGPEVHDDMTITINVAEELFSFDINRFAARVEKLVPPALVQCRFDALVSLAYNIGLGAFGRSTLLKLVRRNPADPTIRAEFMRHVNARVRGKLQPLPGLVARRRAEADHYFGGL